MVGAVKKRLWCSGAHTIELYFLHDGGVVPLAEDYDRQSGVDVPLELGNLLREVFLFGVDDHQGAVLARVETGVRTAEDFHVVA